MTDDVLMVGVKERQGRKGTFHLFTAANGHKFATDNPWVASVCLRSMELGRTVRVWHRSGWYYRNLEHAELLPPGVRA